jgi:hypothetical protein
MARTFISQPNQVFVTEQFDDTLAAGSTLQSTSTSLQSDLNAIRSQIRKVLWAGVSGSWYDAITAPSGTNSARGLNTINTDLTDLEQKRFLFRSQNLNIIFVATGSNFALLSTSLGTSPANHAVVYHPLLSIPTLTGTIVAALSASEGTYGSHSLAVASGSTVLTPKNLVILRDAYTGHHVTASGGRDVYGLLQVQSGALTGGSFNDSTARTQISFVNEVVINQTSSFVATAAASVGGRSYTYSYIRRTALDGLPEDAYLSNTVFLDVPDSSGGGGGGAALVDITLDRAIDNQTGIVSQDQNISIRIAAGFAWTFLSGTKELWSLASSDTGDTLSVAVDRFAVSSSSPSTFQLGATFATSSASPVNVGVISGTVHTLSGSNLLLSGGSRLNFADYYGSTSNYTGGLIPMSTSTIEWNTFTTGYGVSSILGAFNFMSQSLSGTVKRTRFTSGVSTNVAADTNVTFPTNLDVALGSYLGKNFRRDLDIYLNGVLLLPGLTSGDPNDVYPGTSPSSGDLRFPFIVRSGSQISVVVHG